MNYTAPESKYPYREIVSVVEAMFLSSEYIVYFLNSESNVTEAVVIE